MKQRLRFFLTVVILGNIAGLYGQRYYPVRDRMECLSLDGTWQFRLDGGDWRTIEVPGNWETQGVKAPDYGCDLKEMKAVYRRTFMFQPQWKGREVVLRLDGVQNGFMLYVNGQEAGSGHSAHTMQQFNITPYLKEGQNELELHVSTYAKYWLFDVCDAWSFTGIKRSMEIFSVPRKASIADVIFTSKVNKDCSADITIAVKTNGKAGKVTASLLDERYNHVADLQGSVQGDSVSLSAHLQHPRLWNAETPHLYRLNVNLYGADGCKLQSIEEMVGIREVRVENCKILLNNREIFLRGACLSENDAIEGGAMSYKHRRQQLEQMKAANINFIRTAHYPFDPVFARLCDEMGFYVCEEIPFASRGGDYLKNDPDVVGELKTRAKATIDRDRNCPSIIMWSHGNENKVNAPQDSALKFTMEYDPTRLRGVPQAKGAFQSFILRPSEYVNVICGHYANDGVLAEACEKSVHPIINTEYAHSLGTAFGDLEHKYDIFRREPKIAGGSVWCYQDQSVLTRHFNQQDQVLKGVRIDSVRYIDNYGLNPVPEGRNEIGKEGADGIVYGDGYPQEDYFELAQVYTPVGLTPSTSRTEKVSDFLVEVENRFDFISLHGYSIDWQLKNWQRIVDSGTVWLSAEAREYETIGIPINSNTDDLVLAMQVHRPDGSLCYERNFMVNHQADYAGMMSEASGDQTTAWLKGLLRDGFSLRTGRKIEIGLDYRRKNLWEDYMLKPSQLKVKKQKGGYRMTCRWVRTGNKPAKNYIDGDISIRTAKDGTVTIDYTLTPSDSIGGKFLEYGLTMIMPAEYTDVAWLGQGPFSQTPDKTAYNNRDTWQLNKDDIRFYGNRAEVDLMTVNAQSSMVNGQWSSPATDLTLHSENGNILLENLNGHILLTDNLVVGTYGTKFGGPQGIDANKVGQRNGRITLKANVRELNETIFGTRRMVNAEQPYMESYGK